MFNIKNTTISKETVVEFKEIRDKYLVGSPIALCYTISESHTPSSHDWIGLFRIGWKSHSDYVTYAYAPAPIRCNNDKDYEVAFDFSEKSLPEEDGYSYQFCYISKKGVLGASNSFKFKENLVEDLIEYDVGGQSFVESKNVFANTSSIDIFSFIQKEKISELEGQIHNYEQSLSSSSLKILQMEEEIQTLGNERTSLKSKLDEERERVINLNSKLTCVHEEKFQLSQESRILAVELEFMKEKVAEIGISLVREQESHQKLVLELEGKRNQITDLKTKINESNAFVAALQFQNQEQICSFAATNFGQGLPARRKNCEEQLSNSSSALQKELLERKKQINFLKIALGASNKMLERYERRWGGLIQFLTMLSLESWICLIVIILVILA